MWSEISTNISFIPDFYYHSGSKVPYALLKNGRMKHNNL